VGDPFTFGYAITAHKAQGSQWRSVLVYDESIVFGAVVVTRNGGP
jgi:exodeoxyribonuclease-5